MGVVQDFSLLKSVAEQLSGRPALHAPLDQKGPLPADHLTPGSTAEIQLNEPTSDVEMPKASDLKRRRALIHDLLYSVSSDSSRCVVDVEAHFSVHHMQLREICVLDYETGGIAFHRVWKRPVSINFLSGEMEGISAEDFQNLQTDLRRQLEDQTWVGHNIEYDFDVIDRFVSFVPHQPYDKDHLKISLRPAGLIDTRHISWLLMPTASDHKLENLHQALCPVKDHPWHTALGDSTATRELAHAFVNRFSSGGIEHHERLNEAIQALDRRHPLKGLLQLDRDREPMVFASSQVPFKTDVVRRSEEENTRAPDSPDADRAIEQLDRMLKAKSGTGRDGGTYAGQREFIRKSISGIQQKMRTAIESGTGTGKTYAYLASAIEAIRSGKKAIVATPTLNLQNQIWQSAIEFQESWCSEGFDFRVAQVIGSANYFSVQKIYNLSRTTQFEHPAESFLSVYLQLRLYQFRSEHSHTDKPDQYIQDYLRLGNSEQLPSGLKMMLNTAGVSLGTYLCRANEKVYSVGLGKIHFPAVSFLQQSSADLLIENQSLFFRKRLLKQTVEESPSHDAEVIIIDEAHTLLHEGTGALTQTISCLSLAQDLHETSGLTSNPVPEVAKETRGELQEKLNSLLPHLRQTNGELLAHLRQNLNRLGTLSDDDFLDIDEEAQPFNSVSYRSIPTGDPDAWPKLIQCLENLLSAILRLQGDLTQSKELFGHLFEKIETQEKDHHSRSESADHQVGNVKASQQIKMMIDLIDRQIECWSEHQNICKRVYEFSKEYSKKGLFHPEWVFSIRDEEPPTYIEMQAGKKPYEWALMEGSPLVPLWQKKMPGKKVLFPARIELAPLWPGKMLKEVWDQADAAIFTSGTLRVRGEFSSWKEWSGFDLDSPGEGGTSYKVEDPILGLDPMEHIRVWRNSSLSFDPHSSPKQQNDAIARETARANLALGPHTLTLFTSRESLGKTAEILRSSGKAQDQGINIWAQEPGGLSRDQLAKKFRDRRHPSVLLGTRSFWEGIDLPGAVQHLVIPRLPFSNISDPIVEARMESCELAEIPQSGFDQYLLPQMLQQLRQGLGRGIRQESDYCTVHILDSRASWSSYTDQIDQLLQPETYSEESNRSHLQFTGYSKAESYLMGRAAWKRPNEQGKWDQPPGPVRFQQEAKYIQQLQKLEESDDLESRLLLGFQSFSGVFNPDGPAQPHPHQEDAIRQMIERRDQSEVLAVVRATGGGKSAIYKTVAGLERQWGITVVISPLISLMTDQAQERRPGSEGIRSLDSIMRATSRSAIYAEIADSGRGVHLLLTSPERLADAELVSALMERGVARVVVDEGHLLSQWGTGFRPLYRRLPQMVETLATHQGRPIPITLFSATLMKEDFNDLELLFGKPIIQNWDPQPDPAYRKNLVPQVISAPNSPPTNDSLRKLWQLDTLKTQLSQDLKDPQNQVLIFVRTRIEAVLWALALQKMLPREKNKIWPYFAGIPERTLIDQQFNEQKSIRVLVSTSAFGMGVDNHDIHAVYHLELPSSLTEYVQECGRAARHPQPNQPGKHVLIFPGPFDKDHDLYSTTRKSITKSSHKLMEFAERQWQTFTSHNSLDFDQSALLDPPVIEELSPEKTLELTQQSLVRAQELGCGTYLGHLPRELNLNNPPPAGTLEVMEPYKNKWRWKEGVSPEAAWNFLLELRSKIRQQQLPPLRGSRIYDPLIAWKSAGVAPSPEELQPDETTPTTAAEKLNPDQCLRESLYQPFTQEQSPAPHCQDSEVETLCTVCKARSEGKAFVSKQTDRRDQQQLRWREIAQNQFQVTSKPEDLKIKLIPPHSSVSPRRCAPYVRQEQYEKMLHLWLFGKLDWEED